MIERTIAIKDTNVKELTKKLFITLFNENILPENCVSSQGFTHDPVGKDNPEIPIGVILEG